MAGARLLNLRILKGDKVIDRIPGDDRPTVARCRMRMQSCHSVYPDLAPA